MGSNSRGSLIFVLMEEIAACFLCCCELPRRGRIARMIWLSEKESCRWRVGLCLEQEVREEAESGYGASG